MRFPVKTLTTGLAMSLALTLAGTSVLAFPPGTAPPAGMNQGSMPPGHPAMPSGQTMPPGHPAMPSGQSIPSAPAAQTTPITATVVETFNSGGYSYVALDQAGKRIWIATPPVKVAVGEKVSFNPGMVMKNFTSKSLNRTFDNIVFSGGLAPAPVAAGGPKPGK
jgi:hypothetical protein